MRHRRLIFNLTPCFAHTALSTVFRLCSSCSSVSGDIAYLSNANYASLMCCTFPVTLDTFWLGVATRHISQQQMSPTAGRRLSVVAVKNKHEIITATPLALVVSAMHLHFRSSHSAIACLVHHCVHLFSAKCLCLSAFTALAMPYQICIFASLGLRCVTSTSLWVLMLLLLHFCLQYTKNLHMTINTRYTATPHFICSHNFAVFAAAQLVFSLAHLRCVLVTHSHSRI